jgi:hypothetical protein
MSLRSKSFIVFAGLFFSHSFLSVAEEIGETGFKTAYFQYGASLEEAVDRFNRRFGAILEKHSTGKLTADEVLNSLAIGSGFYLRPEHSEVAELCLDSLKKKELPKGSALMIYLWEEAIVGQKKQDRRFVFVVLHINASADAGELGPTDSRVPSEEQLRLMARIPVRLLPYK